MKYQTIFSTLFVGLVTFGCSESNHNENASESDSTEVIVNNTEDENFEYVVENFADIQVLRYQIHGFDKLSLNQQKLVYYLYEAIILWIKLCLNFQKTISFHY